MKKTTGWILGLTLLAAVLLTYSNHFDNGFHFDDSHTINNNIYIRHLSNLSVIFTEAKAFGSMPTNLGFRPVTTASTALDYYMSKQDPLGIDVSQQYPEGFIPFYYHLPMFLAFLLLGLMLFFIIRKIFNNSLTHPWNLFVAFFATAWYLLHPANAETVNYLCQRADLFATFFVVAGLLMYLFSARSRRYYLYLIPPVIGVFAKETAVMFPALLLLYIYFFEQKLSPGDLFVRAKRKQVWGAFKTSLPSFVALFITIVLVQILLYRQTVLGGTLHGLPFPEGYRAQYLITQPWVLATYFVQSILPLGLSSDTGLDVFHTAADFRLWVGLLFIAALLVISVVAGRTEKGRPIAFGLLWFLAASLPTSAFTALTQVSNSHRLIFPYIGLVIALSWGAYLFMLKIQPVFTTKKFSRVLSAVALVLIVSYAYGTWQRNEIWQDDETLWADIVQKNPDNARALMNYGLTKMAAGDLFEAEYYYRKALKKWPNWTYTHINMAILKNAQGLKDQAEQWHLSAINCGGQNQEPYYFYAEFLHQHGQTDKAIANLRTGLSIQPGDLKSRYLLMQLYAETRAWGTLAEVAHETLRLLPGDATALSWLKTAAGRPDESLPQALRVKENPTPEAWLDLSLTHYNRGDYQKCIDACNEALKLKPDYAEAWNNICSAYNAMSMWEEGIAACEKALQINPTFERAANNLKWAQSQKK